MEEPGDSDSERGSGRRRAKTKREQGRPDAVWGKRRRRLSLWVTGGVSLVQGKDKTVRFAISTSAVSRQHVTAKATQITRQRPHKHHRRPALSSSRPSAHHHSFLIPITYVHINDKFVYTSILRLCHEQCTRQNARLHRRPPSPIRRIPGLVGNRSQGRTPSRCYETPLRLHHESRLPTPEGLRSSRVDARRRRSERRVKRRPASRVGVLRSI